VERCSLQDGVCGVWMNSRHLVRPIFKTSLPRWIASCGGFTSSGKRRHESTLFVVSRWFCCGGSERRPGGFTTDSLDPQIYWQEPRRPLASVELQELRNHSAGETTLYTPIPERLFARVFGKGPTVQTPNPTFCNEKYNLEAENLILLIGTMPSAYS